MSLNVVRTDKATKETIHKLAANVGKDVIPDAEYIEFEYITLEREKTFRDKFEDFWFVATMPFWKTKHWIKRTYWKIRYGFQRMFNGYDSVDTFEIFDKFVDRYIKILNKFRNNHDGYPINLQSNDEWNDVLDEMIYHLHYMKEDNIIEELLDGVPEGWTVSNKTVYEIMNKHKDEFFKLFSEYFYSLWD